MTDPWSILVAHGVPLHVGGKLAVQSDPEKLQAALAEIAKEPISVQQGELLYAWWTGLKHQWPVGGGAWVGRAAAELDGLNERLELDPNRVIKLRRIAVENLTHLGP